MGTTSKEAIGGKIIFDVHPLDMDVKHCKVGHYLHDILDAVEDSTEGEVFVLVNVNAELVQHWIVVVFTACLMGFKPIQNDKRVLILRKKLNVASHFLSPFV